MASPFHSVRLAYAAAPAGQHRLRDVASQLGLSEGQLVAAHLDVDDGDTGVQLHAIRLRNEWPELLSALDTLGEVHAHTGNSGCDLEQAGTYQHLRRHADGGHMHSGALALSLAFTHWAHGYAVLERGETGFQRSLQFFDAAGAPVHRIVLGQRSDLAAYEALVLHFAATQQQAGMTIRPLPLHPAELADNRIDLHAFRQAWSALHDAGNFPDLLQRFGLRRLQALRLAPARYAQEVDPVDIAALFDAAARAAAPIQIAIGNAGVRQVRSGTLKNIEIDGSWLTARDAHFHLRLCLDRISSAWIVRLPSVDGLVTALELFDADGASIAMLYAEPRTGRPQVCAWRAIVEQLAEECEPCVA